MNAIIFLIMIVAFPGSVINQTHGIDPVDTVKNPVIEQRFEFNEG